MLAATLLAALLVAQGHASLSQAESLLTQGDTAAAIGVLGRLSSDGGDDVELAAALALEWIGLSPAWPGADREFSAARRRRRRVRGASDFLLMIADLVRTGNARGWDSAASAAVSSIAVSVPQPSLVEGASTWVLARQMLARFETQLLAAIPSQGYAPGCPYQRTTVCVRLADQRARNGLRLDAIVGLDTGMLALRSEITALLLHQLLGRWPFSELALQALLAVEVAVGDSASQATALGALEDAGVSDRSRLLARAALLTFANDRAGAQAIMAQTPEWFESADARTEALQPLPALEPAIMWRLAWALYLEPVNERQVVHRARVLASGPIAQALPRVGKMLWLESDSSLLVRYGLPFGIAHREGALEPTGAVVPVVTYVDRRTRETLLRTTGVVAVSPLGATGPAALAPDLGLAARDTVALSGPSGYVDDHFDRLGPLEHQVVQYFRDGQPLVEIYATRPEAACDTPDEMASKVEQLAGRGSPAIMGFFLLDSRLALVRRAVDSVAPSKPRRYTFQFRPDPGVYVYSVEYFDPACRQAARARYVLAVRGRDDGMALSDIVLSAERRVDGAMRIAGLPRPSALGGLTVDARQPMHLYWEVYGVPADAVEAERFDVAVELLDLGRRKVAVREVPDVARAVEDAPRSLDMRYQAPIVMGGDPLALGLSIDLPPGAEGLHLIRIRVTDRRTGQSAATQRAVFVTR